MNRSRAMDRIGLWVYFVLAVLMLGQALLRPAYTWDTLGYVGAVVSLEESNSSRVHDRTYSIVEQIVSTSDYQRLTDGGIDYRRAMAANAHFFNQEIPLYRARLLYVALVFVTWKIGVNPVTATIFVSSLASLGLWLLVLTWIRRHVEGPVGTLLAALIAIAIGCPWLARTATPDALAAVLVGASAFAAAEHRKPFVSLVFAIGAFLTRVDLVVYVLALIAYLAMMAPRPLRLNRATGAGLGVLALVSYAVLQRASGHYGWAFMFQRTFAETAYPASQVATRVSIVEYFHGLAHGLRRGADLMALPVFLAMSVLGIAAARRAEKSERLLADMIILGLFALTTRFLVLPVLWNRLLAAHYIVIGCASVVLLWTASRRSEV